MTEYIGLALIGLSLIGIIMRVRYLGRRARLSRAIQAWINEVVELYDNNDTDSTA
jgi:hypothetical protein